MRCLVLSTYDAESHRRWHQGLTQRIDAQWELIALPPRYWSWRSGGNALSFLSDHRKVLEEPWDVVIATSITDVATLRGLCPSLNAAKVIVYWHENQFAYPGKPDARLLMKEVYTLLAADVNVFNSAFNRQSLGDGIAAFFEKMPERVNPELFAQKLSESFIIPVGIDDSWFQEAHMSRDPTRILWNHRWEWDKAPEVFFDALRELRARGVGFRLSVHGQQFRHHPDVFDTAQKDFIDVIDGWGYVDRSTYVHNVRAAGIVVSSAIHEFQGLALLEGLAAGLRPVVPDRLAYPEYVRPEHRYRGPNEVLALADALQDALTQPDFSPYTLEAFKWTSVVADWQTLLGVSDTRG